MSKRTANILDSLFNLVIVLCTIVGVGYYFIPGFPAYGISGVTCFRYFTTDSNILLGITCLIMLVFNIKNLVHPERPIPRVIYLIKLVGTVAAAVTMMTVIFFLGPMAAARGGFHSFLNFFRTNVFILHLSNPVLAIVSFLFFEQTERFDLRSTLWSLAPTAVYSLVYLAEVIFTEKWPDFYGFTFGGNYLIAPISLLAMYLVTWGICLALNRLKKAH